MPVTAAAAAAAAPASAPASAAGDGPVKRRRTYGAAIMELSHDPDFRVRESERASEQAKAKQMLVDVSLGERPDQT
ncbi:hypothetical protein GGS24DRAFT_504372 [Hypoxylon argillaceum]|nr:hypothetical protein GGS24DRAFT_504372 [Hypoxylon argillaceum]